jgi:hypothetical protein
MADIAAMVTVAPAKTTAKRRQAKNAGRNP